jgi:hypothetical protein
MISSRIGGIDMDEYVASLKVLGKIYREVMGPRYPSMALVQVVRLVEPPARCRDRKRRPWSPTD